MSILHGYRLGDTIVALATAPLPAGVAIVRVSGPEAWVVGEKICPGFVGVEPRYLFWGGFYKGLEKIDEGLVVGFSAPASFTGEHVVEFHTHGGRAVVQAVLDAILAQPNVRMALPGEFTRRAVINGKMDLTAAEGLADLVAADTDMQRRQAVRQLDGALGERFEGWRTAMLHVLAQVEAAIDFPDEELEILSEPQLGGAIRAILADLQGAVGEEAGVRVRDGLSMALVGRPNAGKSTLLNLLSGREVAIVSPMAGTTRDVVTSLLDIAGYPVQLADTAGIRTTDDVIEAEGVRRARAQAERADVLVVVVDGQDFSDTMDEELADMLVPGRSLVVVSKADLVDKEFPHTIEDVPVVAVNLTERAALGRVMVALEKIVGCVAGGAADAALLTRERHKRAVEEAIRCFGNALILISKAGAAGKGGTVAELVAEDLREAAGAIGSVTGRTGSEDVLDVVFSTFCIGK